MNREEVIQLLISRRDYPLYRGKLEEADATGIFGNPGCGDRVKLYLKFENSVLKDARFEGEGCTISQGVADIFVENILGKTIDELISLDVGFIEKLVGKDVLYMRPRCATVCLGALKEALRLYRFKDSNNT